MSDTKDLGLVLDARIPLIVIESTDEPRVLELLTTLALSRGIRFYRWTSTRGLQTGALTSHGDAPVRLADPEAVLEHLARTCGPALYALCDLHPYLHDAPKLLRHLKDIAQDAERLGNTLVLVSHRFAVPPEIGRLTAKFNLRLPTDDELLSLVRAGARIWSNANRGARVATDDVTLRRLIANLRGVSHADARVLIRHAIENDGAITETDMPTLNKLKFELLDAEGVLRFEYDTPAIEQLAGLDGLKRWLAVRQDGLEAGAQDRPRGVLLLGVQGCGKSLAAKAVAGSWGLPLLRLDAGALYNKFHGETERNLRESLAQAEAMAPCVLWIDEIEKGFAVAQHDNATAQRVLGTLLTWMAEHRAPVFIVATSNDVSRLPPELMRKGRIDEVFFVDLPNAAVRAQIFSIHLRERQLDPAQFDLSILAEYSDGFTGAEIEQAIVAARYNAGAQSHTAAQADIVTALSTTYPLSTVRSEQIERLRAWAKERTVTA